MPTITTLRPSATSSGVGWSAEPSGTLHGVTSDDSDSTYAEWSGDGSPMILGTPLDSPPAGERRHLVRIRARGSMGSAWWAVRLASGSVIAAASAAFSTSPETVAGSWQSGAPADGPTTMACYVEGQTTGVRIVELFLDVDTRAAPTFTPQILDGSGTPTITVTDTVTPTARVSALDLDGLPARQYRYWVTQDGGGIVWDTGVVSGNPVDRQIDPLENGTYTLHMQVWSTLGGNISNPSDEEDLAFTMAVGAVPSPSPPAVSPEEPFYRVKVCAPNVTDFDDYVASIQVQRVDCPLGGYLSLTGLNGSYASTPDSSLLDITGDLEVTIRARRDDGWRPEGGDQTLISKYDTTGDQRSWRLSLDWDGADNGSGADESRAGRPFLAWSPDGTQGSLITAFAEERAPINALGEVHLRAFLDVDNGSGNWEVTFEFLDENGQWQPIGSPVIGSGTTSIHSGSAELAIGAYAGGTEENFEGRIYEAQVRQGRTGPVAASPDFTGHPAGTTSFDDDQGNTWTVSSGATLESSQRIVTVAMLGPLATDECAEWVDYTVPRSGVGRSCDHDPEPCCSYYRARTVGRVDGSILVSDWSDAFNPGIPPGVIFMWPGEDGTIPDGWSRVTELDGRYTKGIPDSLTQPGATGGSATHSHLTPAHTHNLDHSHTTPANTGTASGTFNGNENPGGTDLGYAASHTHTRPNTLTTPVDSQSASPGTDSVANDPAHLEVIWIGSTGTPLGVPDGALALMPDISPSGWDTYADATNRFLKGAAAGQNAGATAASQIANHSHEINSHTHGGVPHDHLSNPTGFTSATLSFFAGPNTTTWTNQHLHDITIGSASTATLQSASGGTSGSENPSNPPYRNLRVRQNNSGGVDLPIGLIAVWRGSLGTIPDGWELCDGNNGTPDLLGRYPRGADSGIGDPGGGLAAHTHTSPSHDHPTIGHSHSSTIGPSLGATADVGSGALATVDGDHTHSSSNTDSETPTVGSSSSGTLGATTTEPPFEEVAFIQLQEAPEPPPEPETFCLEWDQDEHLIRTLGPDGPMYVAVIGTFEWRVDRPFTAETGVMGGRFVTSAPPGGRNLRMTAAVESEADLDAMRAVLSRPLVLISPSDSEEVWSAPVAETVRVVKVGRIRQIQAEFIATGPEPEPQVADVEV